MKKTNSQNSHKKFTSQGEKLFHLRTFIDSEDFKKMNETEQGITLREYNDLLKGTQKSFSFKSVTKFFSVCSLVIAIVVFTIIITNLMSIAKGRAAFFEKQSSKVTAETVEVSPQERAQSLWNRLSQDFVTHSHDQKIELLEMALRDSFGIDINTIDISNFK